MFFGRGAPQSINLDGLGSLINSSFEKKLGSFGERSGRITDSMLQAKSQFIDACDKFETLDAEPYTEDIYSPNIHLIKTQKVIYAKALKRIAEGISQEGGNARNTYERYLAILSNAEAALQGILKMNASYKQMVYCYSNHLRDFKKSFSELERHVQLLKSELDRRSGDFSDYKSLEAVASKINVQSDELLILGSGLSAANEPQDRKGDAIADDSEEEISKNISAKRLEMVDLDRSASNLTAKISLLTLPLERAARKFDHLSVNRKKLRDFIMDPINTIKDEGSYAEFVALVKELKGFAGAGKIDVKNKEDLNAEITSLIDSDIYYLISSLRSMQGKKSGISDEVRLLERTLKEVEESRGSVRKAVHEAEEIRESIKKVSASRDMAKSQAERELMQYYGIRISIIL
ncbi:MAG: hypothetical protein ACYCO0_04845 [Candidatus Micrarchaeaceae archaeon]